MKYLEQVMIDLGLSIPASLLGKKLNTVNSAVSLCPICLSAGTDKRLDVFVNGVQWPCGHTRKLPPLHNGKYSECRTCRKRGLFLVRSAA